MILNILRSELRNAQLRFPLFKIISILSLSEHSLTEAVASVLKESSFYIATSKTLEILLCSLEIPRELYHDLLEYAK
jgi:hypothetical protein